MMSYRRSGAGEPVFLLHGYASSSTIWHSLISDLEKQFDVIAIDWPGFGTSHMLPPYTKLEDFAEGLLELAQELKIPHFHVLGHSMSGFVVQQLLSQHKEALLSAVLYGAGLKLDATRRFESIETTLQRLHHDGAAVSAQRVIHSWFYDLDRDPHALQQCMHAADGMTVEAGSAAIKAMANADFTHLLAQVDVPTLIILGEAERSHPPHSALELHAAIPHAHLAILPFAGHVAHLEQPKSFNHSVKEFLNQAVNLS